MFGSREFGGFGRTHPTEQNSHPDVPIELHLFEQPGYKVISEPVVINRGFRWEITPFRFEKDNRIAVDIMVRLPALESYVSTQFAFQQPGNEKHTFQFTFGPTRDTFFYRRALTIPKVKNRVREDEFGVHYSHYRFLRGREDDEPVEVEEENIHDWVPVIPKQWICKYGLWVQTEGNENFIENLLELENNKNTYVYHFFIEHQEEVKLQRHFLPSYIWPKASIVGRYHGGRILAVDSIWFSPSWPNFKKVMKNVDLLPLKLFEELVEVLGHYYHAWNYNHNRMVCLVVSAERFGFYDFPQAEHTNGNADMYTNSVRGTMIAPKDHPLVKIDSEDEKIGALVFEGGLELRCRLLENAEKGIPPARLTLQTNTKMNMTVNLDRRTYNRQEYLTVRCMVNGRFEEGEHQHWTIHFGPLRRSQFRPVTTSRVLNSVERTISIPTCYSWSLIEKEMGKHGPFEFQIKVEYRKLFGRVVGRMNPTQPFPGVCNGEIICKNNEIISSVNKNYLGHFCGALAEKSTNAKPQKGYNAFKEFDRQDVMHFLDMLYHGSKLLTQEMWLRVFEVAEVIECNSVISMFERAMIRAEWMTEEDLNSPIYQKMKMRELQFNLQMRKVMGIPTVDEYLKIVPELL